MRKAVHCAWYSVVKEASMRLEGRKRGMNGEGIRGKECVADKHYKDKQNIDNVTLHLLSSVFFSSV